MSRYALGRTESRLALIGKVAMWYWLDDEADSEYTKKVDFARPMPWVRRPQLKAP
jgi:hypothetical protein